MKFLKKGLAVLFACTFISVPLYHPVKADAVSEGAKAKIEAVG